MIPSVLMNCDDVMKHEAEALCHKADRAKKPQKLKTNSATTLPTMICKWNELALLLLVFVMSFDVHVVTAQCALEISLV